jgi:hypothetical protein
MARADGPTKSILRVSRTWRRATQTVLVMREIATRDLGAEVSSAIHSGSSSFMATRCMAPTPLSTVTTPKARSRATASRGSPA